MLKSKFFNLFLFSLVVVGSIIITEFALRLKGVKPFQTWLEMDEKGFVFNRRNFNALGFTFSGPTTYRLDSNGFRESIKSQKDEFVKSVLVLGDSFAFGLYLRDEDTIVHHLNDYSSSNFRFLNAGVGGSGTADQIWNFRKYLLNVRFDEVLVLMNFDDVDRTLNSNLFVLKDENLLESQRFKPTFWYYLIHRSKWHSLLEKYSRIYFYRSKLFWQYLFFYDDYKSYPNQTEFIWPNVDSFNVTYEYSKDLWVKIIETFKSECDSNQIQFKIVTTGYQPDSLNNPHSYIVYKQLNEITNKIGVPLLDLREYLFEKSKGDITQLQLMPDNHPNEIATKLIAQKILNTWYN